MASQSVRVSAEETAVKAVPSIEVSLPGEGPFGPARDLVLTIRFKNIPAGAGLVINVVPESGEIRSDRYVGEAPLMLRPLPIGETGETQYAWPKQRTGWAPADGPAWNHPVDIGRYRLHAQVLSRDSFAILGEVASSFPTAKDILADFTTPAFAIVEGP